MKVILCEFDGQLYRCKGKNKEQQGNCKGYFPSDHTNRCIHCKNESYEYICDSDEMRKELTE